MNNAIRAAVALLVLVGAGVAAAQQPPPGLPANVRAELDIAYAATTISEEPLTAAGK